MGDDELVMIEDDDDPADTPDDTGEPPHPQGPHGALDDDPTDDPEWLHDPEDD